MTDLESAFERIIAEVGTNCTVAEDAPGTTYRRIAVANGSHRGKTYAFQFQYARRGTFQRLLIRKELCESNVRTRKDESGNHYLGHSWLGPANVGYQPVFSAETLNWKSLKDQII